jgi:pimeloyl-ACP methyl ester carboxylesterase
MQELYGITTLAATLIAATLLLGTSQHVAAAESAPPTGVKNVVLVHGAFADGSGWEAVAKILEHDGYTVSVAQPPETSYADDVKYARAAVDAMDGRVVIVGHSYGGAIITEAGNDPKVSALVYIAAFELDDGESCASIEQAVPQALLRPSRRTATATGGWNRHISRPTSRRTCRRLCPTSLAASQVPISTDSFTHNVTSPAWKTKPSWHMVATADRSINPEQERMMAKRAHAKTIGKKGASHVVYMSHPKEAAKLIEEAATSAHANQWPIGLYVAGEMYALRTRRERFGAKAFGIGNHLIRADLYCKGELS